jgi:hypothetical protein
MRRAMEKLTKAPELSVTAPVEGGTADLYRVTRKPDIRLVRAPAAVASPDAPAPPQAAASSGAPVRVMAAPARQVRAT